MLSIKIGVIVFIVIGFSFSEGYTQNADLNGKVFHGKATEITPPNSDKKPMILDETISFLDGKMVSEIFKTFSVNDCYYYSELDERRAMAFSVVNFRMTATGEYNGDPVEIKFSGDVIAYTRLIGTIIIQFSDNTEMQYSVQAAAQQDK